MKKVSKILLGIVLFIVIMIGNQSVYATSDQSDLSKTG